MNDARTVAARLTPSGRGAVATIGVRGPSAIEFVARYFSPAASASAPLNQIRFGRWQRAAESVGEELVICRTQDDTIEIHCHGGTAAVDAIIADLRATGTEIVDGAIWIEQTAIDSFAAEALSALAEARTERTAAILLDQYRGALSAAIRSIGLLLATQTSAAAVEQIDELLAWGHLGLHLTRPFRVVLAGAPNVGKSSLINALLGYDRSIVFDQPGTTRDVVSALTALDGWPVELSDTAGIRSTSDLIEAAGVARAEKQLNAADLVLWILDASQPFDASISTSIPTNAVLVCNKADLVTHDASVPAGALLVSAQTRAGLGQLKDRIVQSLVPRIPPRGAAVPFLAAHLTLLQKLRSQASTAEC